MNELFCHGLCGPVDGGVAPLESTSLAQNSASTWTRRLGDPSIVPVHSDDIATMTELNLPEILEFAVSVAKDAGRMILKASNSRLSSTSSTMSEKKNGIRSEGLG
jgi:hypothetical protein